MASARYDISHDGLRAELTTHDLARLVEEKSLYIALAPRPTGGASCVIIGIADPPDFRDFDKSG